MVVSRQINQWRFINANKVAGQQQNQRTQEGKSRTSLLRSVQVAKQDKKIKRKKEKRTTSCNGDKARVGMGAVIKSR